MFVALGIGGSLTISSCLPITSITVFLIPLFFSSPANVCRAFLSFSFAFWGLGVGVSALSVFDFFLPNVLFWPRRCVV